MRKSSPYPRSLRLSARRDPDEGRFLSKTFGNSSLKIYCTLPSMISLNGGVLASFLMNLTSSTKEARSVISEIRCVSEIMGLRTILLFEDVWID